MGLSYDIISEFVKITNGNKEKPKEGIVYATIVQASDGKYVKIDGSDLLTPTDTTTDIEDGERVTVMIKDHRATVTGNVTAPSASGNRVDKVVEVVSDQLGVFETVVADKVSTNELEAYKATIEHLIAGKAEIEDLEATNAEIENLKVKNAEIENAVIDKATIEDLEAVNAVIENLKAKDAEIENLVADKATINDLNAVNADIQNLKAQHAHIEDLVADKADIEDLEAVNAEIENLKVKDAEIENLVADKATIEDLEATKAEIEVLDADFAEIKTLVSGNLTSDNILSFNITADKVTMEDAFIKDAMIDTVNAAKINAGRINTNSVVIGSEDGGMRISGATQQFTDKNGNVRIQIGRDASNDFTFALYGEDGQGQIINQNGITASAIADGLIVNDMVSDNAAISGGKLDISSVVTEINNDNTTTIKSNKIYLDEQNQSLEVAFKSLKTQVDTIKDIDSDLTTITDKIQSNTSKIEANKSSISTLLAEDAAIKKQVTDLEGNVVETTNTLTSKYTSLQQNLDGFKTTVNNTYATKTSVNDVKNNLSSNYSTTSAMNSAINQKVDEITASVSSTYATKNEVKTIDDNIKANYSTTEQMSSAISVAKDEINLGISKVYETKTEVSNKIGGAIDKVLIGGRNLIIRNTETKNYYIGTDGSLSEADGYGVSDYIKVDSGESLAFSKKDSTTTDNYFRWAWYGNDKTYINRTPNNSNKFIWVVPSGAAYVRISYPLDCYPKVERGTKHTDWTPAPEDVDTSINNAITTSKDYTDSQIKISKDAIELGVSQTYETKTSVTSQISNTLTSAKSYADTKKSEAISTASSDATSKANNALNSAKSYADTKKSEAITSANNTLNTTIANYYTKTQTDSQIKIAKDAINLGVSETYETKTNVTSKVNSAISTASSDATSKANNALSSAKSYADTKKSEAITSANNTLNSTIANYYTKAQTDSQIKIAKDAIDLSVKSTYETKTEVANKINAIQIGGRNLIIRNTETKNYYIGADGSLSKVNGYGVSDYIKVDSGESLAFSKKDSATTDDYFRWAWYGSDKTYMNRTPNNSNKFLWTVPSGAAYVRISYPLDCYPKVERGTKHTDWSPAPEDIDNSISNAITESNEYTDSQIKISKDAIELGVSQTYETKSSVSSQISSTLTSAKSYADTKKSEAISTASSDATSKANNALSSAKSYADTKKSEAINSANSTLNTTIANYYTKTQTDSQIKASKDAIELSVKNTYETKTEVSNKINSIQVGGMNLAYDTNKGATGWGWGIQTNNGRTITSETINGVNCVKFVKDATSGSGWNYVNYGRFKRDKITPSTTYVVSFEMKSNLSFNVASVNLMNGDSSNTLLKTITAVQNKVVANSTAWNKIIFKLTTLDTLPTSTAQVVYITGVPYSANATHYIRNLKLEVGNKATQWSPAPEDITADINTAKSDAITSANNTLNTTIANYYTKTQTDSQIKVAKDAITSSVSSTYETKTNVNALKNQINQTKQNIRCNDLGAKINYSEFSTGNAGEIYLHGYDSNNNPTDTNGKIYWNGAALTVVKGMINPNSEFPFNTDVYIFVNKTTSSTWIHGCYYNTSTKAWAYKSLIGGTSSATSWTPDQNHVAIGVFNMSEAEAFNHAYLFETPQSLLQLTVGSDNLASRMNTAEQKITDSAIVSTVTSSTTYKNNLTGKVDKTTIISSINQTAESVKINASKIELTGSVVVNAINGGSTLINGSKIQTGTISANSITSGTFQGTNFIAGGSSNGNGYFQVKDSSNDVKFHASKDGVYATKIQFPDSISISGSIIQSGNISASSSGFTTSGSESGSLYRMEYNSNLGPLGLKISSQYYNTEGGGNVAGTKKTIDITGDTIGFTTGSTYTQLSQRGTNIYSQGGYDSYNGYYCDGTMSLKKASHGGIDIGNTSTRAAICSNTSPVWWNGSASYDIFNSGNCTITSGSGGTSYRFANGLQINTMQIWGTWNITTAWGSVYSSPYISPSNYTQAFLNPPQVSITAHGAGTAIMVCQAGAPTTTSPGSYYLWKPVQQTGVKDYIEIISIGRWK